MDFICVVLPLARGPTFSYVPDVTVLMERS